ncbi:Sec-independent protein translocase protein TatB [Pseudofrankia inefficax]|uniref:Twin-arginine translocation protein, TatB subunit n=1 Tax=Pseudofrankia inefficax (strain DSM 45817 / CECT 9037 / DDB 130130 / EuI1c) TaxID=298654 RepID=E3ITP8_PSEI1|nr:Sec-independent protein translocase protein TatB [Pseudofrankia inefficax]ADP78805.1 twin-arginine translocation protein, TatB subunit [Pseudofrankia inefficax]
MFNGLGWGEIAVLLVIGLFVFGPDKLPRVARDAGRLIRQLRQMATGVTNDLRAELGPEYADLDIRDLHPKTFVRKALLEDDDELFPSILDKHGKLDLFGDDTPSGPLLTKDRSPGGATSLSKNNGAKATTKASPSSPAAQPEPADTPWDTDAT